MKLKRNLATWLLTLLALLIPGMALASGEANVALQFSSQDKIYLYISLAFGAIAIGAAWVLAKWVKAQGEGTEKMIEVSGAIREGALAYLLRQIKTMLPFVLILGVGIAFLYSQQFSSWTLGGFTALAFIGGVAASYIAGYAGMLMAVDGNKRTAFAALTSYKKTLEIAFRSGAVAGMVTVGMGLIGATAIFLFGGEHAMKFLIGFGFGGSLAALFMRVGGGIFTKAADVGADLVGKVEAGIPEDDPRNPATIADNVGDNVGDCAGMAADVFESYEVTLVAAIVLGAATAAIFDQQTWMKLVLFALMARGVGILASIIGIFSVKGSDDLDADPLKSIKKGFTMSAVIAILLTVGLAYFMMGPSSGGVNTTRLMPLEHYQREQSKAILKVRDAVAKEKGKKADEITAEDITGSTLFTDAGFDKEKDAFMVGSALAFKEESAPKLPVFEKYSKIDWNTVSETIANYAVQDTPEPGATEAKYVTLKDKYSKTDMYVYQVKVVNTPDPAQNPGAKPEERELWVGPYEEKTLKDQIDQATKQNASLKVQWAGNTPSMAKNKVELFANPEGEIVLGVPRKGIDKPHNMSMQGISFWKDTPANMKAADEKRKTDPSTPFKPPTTVSATVIESTPVEWWKFAAAIFFGIVMAFLIEALTDYYVSLKGKPVREVAGVASAGPAPMIISGFALAAESSVFLVFGMVLALIFPMILFPPDLYGSYILSFYGIALVGLGLLTTTGFILAMDTFGPISDNAQGVFEMSGAGHESEYGSKAVQRLDAAGNTTKALTKGFAIATAVVAAVALFHSFIEDAMLSGRGLPLEIPEIFLGLLIGGAAPYLFSGSTINAGGRGAFPVINEDRRQFREDPGIMKGTSKPNYGSCVAIVTKAAQAELLGPAILAIALPMAVAFGFSIGKAPVSIGGSEYNLVGAQALGGFLAGAILSGQLMAVLLANSGGIWDNSKKLIEDGMHGGKGTDAHKAAVVCDTVGDPFKDTAGPALNPLIKVMNLVALLMVGTIIKPLPQSTLIIITVICVAALAFSIWWSKRSSMSEGLVAAGAIDVAAVPSAPVAPAAVDTRKRITVEETTTAEEEKEV
ncbi:MAG TPA: sodium/proton-translocating pyrophosphatase [Fimbriimonadaceae bacterium]|nr:sodium/proton-translocating pyrophosphatase [Fimbriimonadaceae bacterium]